MNPGVTELTILPASIGHNPLISGLFRNFRPIDHGLRPCVRFEHPLTIVFVPWGKTSGSQQTPFRSPAMPIRSLAEPSPSGQPRGAYV